MSARAGEKHDGGWLRLDSRRLFDSPWYGLRQDRVRLPAGDEITYTVVDHPGYAMVVPLLDDGRVLLERVYRYTVQETVLECPSGGLDSDPPEIAAARELREETGYRASTLTGLGSFFGSNGISNEEFHLYLATGIELEGEPLLENTEQLELEFMAFDKAYRMALEGRIKDGPSALGLILAWHHIHGHPDPER